MTRSAFSGLVLFACLATFAGCASERGTTETRMGGDVQWHGRIYRGTAGAAAGEQSTIAAATMTRTAGGGENIRATVTGRGGLTPGSYPWHVHSGTCGSDGAIVGNPDEYPLLEAGGAGMGSVTADFSANVNPDGQYYVNIHQSEEDLGTIVACGNLERG